MCSLYTNIPQEEGINVVCQYYEEHYQSKQPIPTTHLGELMRLILKENSFKFNDKHFLQTHGIAMGTKMAVAFAVIFMAHIEKQLLAASPQKPIFWKRFIDDIFSVWTLPEKEISTFVDFANSFHATIKFILSHQKELISSILKFSKDHASLTTKLWMFKHITSPQKRFNIRTSLQVTLSALRRVLFKDKLCVC